MPPSSNINTYRDVQQVLDTALASGGAIYKLPSHAEAVAWRHRANKFRSLAGKQGFNVYDSLSFSLAPSSREVVIKIRSAGGALYTPDGKQIPLKDQIQPVDPLLEEAQRLVEDLGDDQ